MARATSRKLTISIGLSVIAFTCLATNAMARDERPEKRKLTIDEALEASALTGAPILAVAGTAE